MSAIEDSVRDMEDTLRILASGRKPCASGTQRVCRDEMKSIARECCIRNGISWRDDIEVARNSEAQYLP